MRIMFAFTGGSGHLRPLLPFARAAQAAGHAVTVAGSGGMYEEILATGFPALRTSEPRPRPASTGPASTGPASTGPEALTAPDPQREERTMREAFAGRGARRHAKAVRELALEWQPDVMVRDEVDFGTGIAAQTLGIPCVTVIVLLAGGLIRPDVVAEPLARPPVRAAGRHVLVPPGQ
jgi:UDP:flavonoid glycosyltransferase YjiC (YdhE family)